MKNLNQVIDSIEKGFSIDQKAAFKEVIKRAKKTKMMSMKTRLKLFKLKMMTK